MKKDPTSKVEREIGEALKECKKKGNMTRECRLRLTPRAWVPPQLYGLPEMPKVGVPLVVTWVRSSTEHGANIALLPHI